MAAPGSADRKPAIVAVIAASSLKHGRSTAIRGCCCLLANASPIVSPPALRQERRTPGQARGDELLGFLGRGLLCSRLLLRRSRSSLLVGGLALHRLGRLGRLFRDKVSLLGRLGLGQ